MPETTVQSATAILTSVVRSLVSEPDRVKLDATYTADFVAFTLSVAPEDVAIVTGAGGRTGRSLRAIVAALGKRSGLAVSLEIKARQR